MLLLLLLLLRDGVELGDGTSHHRIVLDRALSSTRM
jgi:hypothetical protein